MAQQTNDHAPFFRLQELCERLGVMYRDARYICEKGWLPVGVDPEPGRGNHRWLTPAQAVWLGIVLKLKACGVRTKRAAQIAGFAEHVKGFTRHRVWDWHFLPFDGAFAREQQWLLEVGDMQLVRFVTDGNPSKQGLDEMQWVDMDSRRTVPDAQPIIRLRVDIAALARLLQAMPQGPGADGGQAGQRPRRRRRQRPSVPIRAGPFRQALRPLPAPPGRPGRQPRAAAPRATPRWSWAPSWSGTSATPWCYSGSMGTWPARRTWRGSAGTFTQSWAARPTRHRGCPCRWTWRGSPGPAAPAPTTARGTPG